LKQRLPLRDGYPDVAELQAAGVVALDVERAGRAFIGVERASGDAVDLSVIGAARVADREAVTADLKACPTASEPTP